MVQHYHQFEHCVYCVCHHRMETLKKISYKKADTNIINLNETYCFGFPASTISNFFILLNASIYFGFGNHVSYFIFLLTVIFIYPSMFFGFEQHA